MRFLNLKYLFLVFVIIFFPFFSLLAENSLNFSMSNDDDAYGIEVSVSLSHIMERTAAIRDGVPFKIIYIIKLYEKREGLIHKNVLIKTTRVVREVSFDDYNKRYLVKEGENKFHFTYSDNLFDYLLHLKKENIYDNLEIGKKYLVFVKVKGETITLYFPISIVFNMFIDLWDFKLGPYYKEFIVK